MQNINKGTTVALNYMQGTQVAKTVTINTNKSEIYILQLPVGVYIYRIFDKKGEILSGK